MAQDDADDKTTDKGTDEVAQKLTDLEAKLADTTGQLREFRNNNIALQEQVKSLQTEKDDATKSADKATGEAKSMAERLAALEEANAASTAEAEAAKATARKTTLGNTLTKAGAAVGVDRKALGRFSEAHMDALDIGEDGKVYVKGENGPRISKAPETAGEPMQVKEFAGLVLHDEPFWAAASSGDGAGGDGGGDGGSVKTITREQFKHANKETMDKVSAGEIAVAVE